MLSPHMSYIGTNVSIWLANLSMQSMFLVFVKRDAKDAAECAGLLCPRCYEKLLKALKCNSGLIFCEMFSITRISMYRRVDGSEVSNLRSSIPKSLDLLTSTFKGFLGARVHALYLPSSQFNQITISCDFRTP